MRVYGSMWVTMAITVAACGGGEATVTTPTTATTTAASPDSGVASSLVLGESEAPPGMEFVGSLSWQELRPGLDDLLAGDTVEQLESLGLLDASASVFVRPGSDDTGTVDFDSGVMLAVSAVLAFGDGVGATSALEIIQGAAMVYVGAADATARPFDVVGVAEGVVGLMADDRSFPGGAAAVAWVEGGVVRISFAQGGDPTRDAQTLAEAMREMSR